MKSWWNHVRKTEQSSSDAACCFTHHTKWYDLCGTKSLMYEPEQFFIHHDTFWQTITGYIVAVLDHIYHIYFICMQSHVNVFPFIIMQCMLPSLTIYIMWLYSYTRECISLHYYEMYVRNIINKCNYFISCYCEMCPFFIFMQSLFLQAYRAQTLSCKPKPNKIIRDDLQLHNSITF